MSTTDNEYQPGQWWLQKLESLWGSGEVDLDTRRAAKVACNFAAQVFATLDALPQTPPAPAGAGSSSTPRVDALMAKWDDDGATRGAAFCELRDLARELERDAIPKAAPAQPARGDTEAATPPDCDPDIFQNGAVIAVMDGGMLAMEGLVKEANRSGHMLDWHYVAGRAVVKAHGDYMASLEAFKRAMPKFLHEGDPNV